MVSRNNLEDFITQFIDKLPPGLKQFKQDIENHAKTIVIDAAKKSDLITREEFETQKKVLQKTRALVEKIEKKLVEIEKNTNKKDNWA